MPEWVDSGALAWAALLVPVLALLISGAPAWALLVAVEWESQGLAGSGPAEVHGPAEAPGQVGGQAADGLAGAVAAGGHGWAQAQASHWLPRGRTTVATVTVATVTMIVSSGGLIGAG